MKKLCLAEIENGQVQDILAKVTVSETNADDAQKIMSFAVKEYYGDLEGDYEDE